MNTPSRTDAILEALNPQQRQAVETIQGPLMTLAGPGSGKTRVVTHRIAYMISQGISSRSILAMTFTNKAAQTIRERVRQLVGDQPVTMGTFHGFGARFLRRYGRAVGLDENFSIYDTDDSKRALEEAILKSKANLTYLTVGQIAKEISRLKTNLITPEALDPHRLGSLQHVVSQVYPIYQKQLIECRAVDFDDLLLHPAMILRSEPELRAELDSRYQFILVDEYQDTNFAQYVIIRALSVDYPNLNVTGDPDQSIYGWRGANIENILSFEKDFPTAQVVRLEQNYRSTPEILSVADALIFHNKRRKAKNLVAVRSSGPKVRLVYYHDDRHEAEHIIDQIRSNILEHGRRASEFAILYRTNAQSRLFEKALLARRLDYQLIGGFRFYHRQEIKDLIAYLRLVHNACDDVAFDRVINTPPRGLGDKTLGKIYELAVQKQISKIEALTLAIDSNLLAKKAATGANDFLRLYSQLIELSSGKLVDVIAHLIKATDYVEYLAKKKSVEPDDSVDENVNELLADARQIDDDYPEANGLETFLEQVSLIADADRFEGAADRVTLMTLHSAKGLEFPSVYLIAVEQDILPHIRSMQDPKQLEEERRLLFVGITRAKDCLQLSTANRRGFQNRTSVPSPFLMEIPRLELEVVDMTESSFQDEENEYDDDFGDDSEDYTAESAPAYQAVASKKPSSRFESSDLSASLVRGSKISPLTTMAGVRLDLFHIGGRVQHPVYGSGSIVSVDGHGVKRRANVRFDTTDVKSFFLASSPLTLS